MFGGSSPIPTVCDASFDDPGDWHEDKWAGPAVNIPNYLLDLSLKPMYSVEFLPVGSTIDSSNEDSDQTRQPRKNHVVVRLTLKQPIGPPEKEYHGVRIAIDLADNNFEVIDDDESGSFFDSSKISSEDFYAGQFNVKFLPYTDDTKSAFYVANFDMKDGLTLGDIIRAATTKKLDRFVFEGYGTAWKGCRDFNLQLWNLFVEKGWVEPTDTNSGETLVKSIAHVYGREGRLKKAVDTGIFVRFSRVQDHFTHSAYVEEAQAPL